MTGRPGDGKETRIALHPRQTYVIERVARSSLKAAPYNPRKLDAHAKAKLRANLAKIGLVQALTWNRRTGNLVCGHQRLAILDALAETEDYLVDICVVDLDEREERAQNLFMNNPSAQGWWDEEALDALLREDAALVELGGFDPADIAGILDAPVFAPMFQPEAQSAEAIESAEEVEKSLEAARRWREKNARKRDELAAKDAAQSAVLVVACETRAQANDILRLVGGDPGSQYVYARRVIAALTKKEE